MAAPPGSRLNLDFATPLSPPDGGSIPLAFTSLVPPPSGVGAGDASAIGRPAVRLRGAFVRAAGWDSMRFPAWSTQSPHVEKAAQRVSVAGWQAGAVQAPTYVRWRRFVTPRGFFDYGYGVEQVPAPRARYLGSYTPPPGAAIVLNFAQGLNPPPGVAIVLEFGAVGYGHVLGATAGAQTDMGAVAIDTSGDTVKPVGFAAGAVGTPSFQGSIRYVNLNTGIAPPFNQVSTAHVRKGARDIAPEGIRPEGFGPADVWLWRRYYPMRGIDSCEWGSLTISLQHRALAPSGTAFMAIGAVTVVNSRAAQRAAPRGIATPGFGAVNVSPRIIYPVGLFASAMGASTVQRNPSPAGFDLGRVGWPKVEFGTRFVAPVGPDMWETGYPHVRDRAIYVQHAASTVTTVFGDVLARNLNKRVRASGWESFEASPWAWLALRDRVIEPEGIDAALAPSGDYRPPDLDLLLVLVATHTPGLDELVILPRLRVETSGHRVENAAFSVGPAGFESLVWGRWQESSVGAPVRTIKQAGNIFADGYGKPALTNRTPQLHPAGMVGAMGLAGVTHRVRTIEHKGRNSLAIGAPTVWFRYRILSASGTDTSAFGAVRLEHERRTLLGFGVPTDSYGAARISHFEQIAAPPGIDATFAANHMVGTRRWLKPAGLCATRFGARIIPEILPVYPLGFTNPFGEPAIANAQHIVRPSGFVTVGQHPADRWGTACVFNWRQYVAMFYDPDSGLNPPAGAQWTLIENRNREVGAIGRNCARFGFPTVDNRARPLKPAGIASPVPSAHGMVAFRLRPLGLDGIEAPYMSGWARIYNDGRVLAPAGLAPAAFGAGRLENTRRYYKLNGFDSAWCGYPMIAPRIRTLDFEARYAIAPPVVPLPELKQWRRFVEPEGFDASGIGGHHLEIHFTIVTPRWTLQNLYGLPRLHKVTPELGQRGRNSEEFGTPFVRLQWRDVTTAESYMTQFGRTGIADKRRTITMAGLKAGAIGDKLTVIKTGSPPYSQQTIDLNRYGESGSPLKEGFGIDPPKDQVGLPIMNQRVIYVRQNESSTRLGRPIITANSIRVEPGIQQLVMGAPGVSLRIRTVVAGSCADVFEPSKPRLDPHTIWATMEAPQQAIDNHPVPQQLHYVDGRDRPPGAIFGYVIVQNRHNKVAPTGVWPERLPRPTIFNRRQRIELKGFTSFRSGWHVVPGPQTAEPFKPSDTMVFGSATVTRGAYLGPRTLAHYGYGMTLWGANRIELLNREVKPVGLAAQAMGASRGEFHGGYAWQSLHVGPPMPTKPPGADCFVAGKAWASLRVRELATAGFDAFLSEYDPQAFAQRMRVRNATTDAPPRQFVLPEGFDANACGAADLRLGVRYIRPDGNSDQYRKGAF